MKTVLITAFHYLDTCTAGVKLLEEHGVKIVANPGTVPYTREELKSLVAEATAVITGNEVWDEDVYQAAPNLKVIARFGIGVDNIDLAAARSRGIKVCNAPGATNAVAELVVGFIIMLKRHLRQGGAICRAGKWDRMFGSEIRGSRVGLIGFGRIPRLIAQKLSGFSCEILACDKYPDEQAAQALGVRLTDMDEILRGCDIVSLHLPATGETRGIMDKGAFEKMKDGAYFINTGRGALVDEAALYAALSSGRLAGAACDVFAQEPVRADNPLLSLDNFVCTPHWGSDTVETVSAVGEMTARNVVRVLCLNQLPDNYLNP